MAINKTKLSEKLVALDKQEQKVTIDKPSGIVYSARSGTKDIQVKSGFNIGGKSLSIKKVARQPLQIYGGEEYLKNINKPRQTIKAAIVNPTRAVKIPNRDTRPNMMVGVSKVYGMVLMGGAGVEHASGKLQTLNEQKILKMTFLEEDI